MAQSGTITQTRDTFRNLTVKIAGVTQGNFSPSFRSYGYAIGSFVVSGTFGAAPIVSLQGSNDGGLTFVLVGTTFSGTSPYSGALIGTNNEIFQLYNFLIGSGGDGTTSLNFNVFLGATFG